MLRYLIITIKTVYCPSETALNVRHILAMHPCERRILCVQRSLRNCDFDYYHLLKVEYSIFRMTMKRSISHYIIMTQLEDILDVVYYEFFSFNSANFIFKTHVLD
jgi:hypothetical protein